VANKVKGVRAALVYNLKTAKLSRQHNNTNALVLPSYLMKPEQAKKVVLAWLKAEFEGGRHLRRVSKINEIEERE
jgi:ribose 5-phosphate isomerase B